jgi:protein-tyrosine-phosphatase
MAENGGLDMKQRVALFVVFNMVKRVFDQAKNVCEETVFAVFGESKAPKEYKILFIDEDNSSLSQIAEAFARKQYPDSGEYDSAGRRAAEQLDASAVTFLQNHGLFAAGAKPTALDTSHDSLAAYHVVVSLQGQPESYVKEPPFHTSLLDWDIGPIPEDLSEADRMNRFEEAYREIAVQVRDLMEMLHGDGAS